MGIAITFTMFLIPLIIIFHVLAILLIIMDVLIALDKNNKFALNLEFDFGSCLFVIFIIYTLQQLLSKIDESATMIDNNIFMNMVLSVQIETAVVISMIAMMIFVSLRQLIQKHHHTEKSTSSWKA
ncbi:MAG: hypothetical protein HRU20_13300 [Pseudomonadales bacterium]|nr:hypothetical protein [Pseudomonadales bacterium]